MNKIAHLLLTPGVYNNNHCAHPSPSRDDPTLVTVIRPRKVNTGFVSRVLSRGLTTRRTNHWSDKSIHPEHSDRFSRIRQRPTALSRQGRGLSLQIRSATFKTQTFTKSRSLLHFKETHCFQIAHVGLTRTIYNNNPLRRLPTRTMAQNGTSTLLCPS